MPDNRSADLLEPPITERQPNRDELEPPGPTNFLVARMSAGIVFLSFLLIYLLIKIFPGQMPVANRSTVALGWGGRFQIELWIETRYLLIVALSGAIGSYIHLATSFADFVGNRALKSSWQVWYLFRPFIGAFLAVVVYFVVRGGLISGFSDANPLSPYGIAALAGMCGLFSKEATDKLKSVFEELFRTKVQRADPLNSQPDPNGNK